MPDAVEFPEFDENLRDAFRQESELFFESLIRENRSVLDLLGNGYTYMNERLAKHYGVPNVYGSHFRRIYLDGEIAEQRGGILGQGSLLTATSYANRTSPVLRGKWILTNILGTPPPAPPPDVADLPESGLDGQPANIRDRMLQHRADPACSGCHAPMDPLGLALENYDAIGRWRITGEAGLPIDASGQLPNGSQFYGLQGLRGLLLERSDEFIGTVTEKLLAYAMGRPPEYFDKPTIRSIVRNAALENHSWSSIIVGIVQSAPFRNGDQNHDYYQESNTTPHRAAWPRRHTSAAYARFHDTGTGESTNSHQTSRHSVCAKRYAHGSLDTPYCRQWFSVSVHP